MNDSAKSSLPVHNKEPFTDIKGLLSPVAFDGTEYATAGVEIDFLPQVIEVGSNAAANGRADIMHSRPLPTITIHPPFATAWEDSFDAGSEGPVMVQAGAGVLSTLSVATSAVTIASNVATATVPEGHGMLPGMLVTTSGLTTDVTTPVAITSVGPTSIVFPLTDCDGAMADGVGTIVHQRANALVVFAQSAQVQGEATENDNKYLRKGVTLQVTDAGIYTGTTPYHFISVGRV